MQPIRKAEMASDTAAQTRPLTGVRIREIRTADLAAVAALLTRGFAFRSEAYWLRGLERHAARPRPAGFPAFGYCLDHGGVPVGVILLLFSNVQGPDGAVIVRANVSSWYVEPAFRAFSSMLVRAATRDKTVTYFNITPAPHTWPQVEAQGFSVYCKGQIYAAPALSRPVAGVAIDEFAAGAVDGLSAYEIDLLRQHADWGCLSVVAREAGVTRPFVFQKHHVKNILPIYRLLYCRDMADLTRLAGNLGRFLLGRGGLLVRLDANAAMPALVGWYSDKRGRKYAKGPHPPRLGDLAFTEAALFDR
ncbi:acyl-CoA acyltransferase [Bradyrhizobium sp. SRS-191]|uniref:acyl-CoA acyltransferase n=1 Tax=Bradyrhizobium sp. SRS-191 TaxID=2962606 RepID=UPI00211DECC1|nr:acyl-CoA acyltransferase [Bradyrhizobium sp. SRS-191]